MNQTLTHKKGGICIEVENIIIMKFIFQVKARLHNRLQELEPLPEMLKTTELRLHDANERMMLYERKNTENTKLIVELTTKVGSS